MKADEMDSVFAALASETRRRVLDILKQEPGCNVNRVCEFFDIGRVAVMKHLDVLHGANLVISEKVGRERLLYFNPVPIHKIYDRWTTEFRGTRRRDRQGTRRVPPSPTTGPTGTHE
jgi:predicted transcriptional regulator